MFFSIKSILASIIIVQLISWSNTEVRYSTMVARGQQTCFDRNRFPKYIQSLADQIITEAEAITKHDGLNSIFVGGYIAQESLKPVKALDHGRTFWAHIGRISIETNAWLWTKIISDSGSADGQDGLLATITALAVDDAGSKLVAHGHLPFAEYYPGLAEHPNLNRADHTLGTVSFIFTLDAETGASRSKLIKINHGTDLMNCYSSGLLLQNGGTAYMALQLAAPIETTTPWNTFASIDTIGNVLNYVVQTGPLGHSGSLVQTANNLYVGGSYAQNVASPWHLAFMRIPNADLAGPPSATISTLAFKHQECQGGSSSYFTTKNSAPYIRLMGHHPPETGYQSQLFGLAQSNAYGSSGPGTQIYAWRAELDVNGDVDIDETKFHVVQFNSLTLMGPSIKNSQFIGMRSTMEYDGVGNHFYIHFIYTDQTPNTFYARVCTNRDHVGNFNYKTAMYQTDLGVDQVNIGKAAVFAGARTSVLPHSTGNIFQSYAVGQMKDYRSHLNAQVDIFPVNSYAVWPAITENDPDNCVNYEQLLVSEAEFTTMLPDDCTRVEQITELLYQDPEFTFSAEDMLIYDLQMNYMWYQMNCHQGVSIDSWSAGVQPTPISIIWNYGAQITTTFVPNQILSPSDCTDPFWLYQSVLPAGFPSNIQVSFDSLTDPANPQFILSQSHGETTGFQTGFAVGTFVIGTNGILLNQNGWKREPTFDWTLQIDCCYQPTIITPPNHIYVQYPLGDPVMHITLNDDWIGDNTCCRIKPEATIRAIFPELTSGWTWDGASRTLSIYQTEADSLADPTGLKVKEFYDFQIWHETYPVPLQYIGNTSEDWFVYITVEIYPPNPAPPTPPPPPPGPDPADLCETDVLTVDAENELFQPPPVTTLNLAVKANGQFIIVEHDKLIKSSLLDNSVCGPIIKEFWDVSNSGQEQTLNPNLFTQINLSSQTQLYVQADSMDYTGSYVLRLIVFYRDFPDIMATRDFIVTIYNPCAILSPSFDLSEQEYLVGSGPTDYDIQTIAENGFRTNDSQVCGAFQFTAQLTSSIESSSPSASEMSSQTKSSDQISALPFIITENSEVIRMNAFGEIEVHTDDCSLIGIYNLYISAKLIDYPHIETQSTTRLPIRFKRCEVFIQQWDVPDIVIPASESFSYTIQRPVFSYQSTAVSCQYTWESIGVKFQWWQESEQGTVSEDEIDSVIDDLRQLSSDNNSDENEEMILSDVIEYDEATNTINCHPMTFKEARFIEVSVTASLSDGITSATNSFIITYSADMSVQNQAPYFLKEPKKLYTIINGSEKSELNQLIKFGEIVDDKGAEVQQEFNCPNCELVGLDMTYNYKQNIIYIPENTPVGLYGISITLSDNDPQDPQSTQYIIEIQVENASDTDSSETNGNSNNFEAMQQSVIPNISVNKFSQFGELHIDFSQRLKIPQNLTEIDSDVIEFKIKLDETSTVTDKALLDFTWKLIEFSDTGMIFEVLFTDPLSISSGVQRDNWIVTIRDPEFFVSVETFTRIPMNSTDEIRLPKMMPNTEFAQQFVSVTDGMGKMAATTLVGNYVINLTLSGAMHFLWGLMHCLQIVAHFPMMGIMMPANAHQIFLIIMQIAQFNIVPLEQAMADAEVRMGIENDEFEHSDNFVEFGYESSDVILNLQIMFLFILFLIVFPIILALVSIILKRKQKCTGCLEWIEKKLFWSTYIRFTLESYLEIALAGILRLKNFSFQSGSETFHSIVAIVFLTFVVVFLVISTVCMQKNKGKLKNQKFYDKYGEMTLGIKHNSTIDIKLATTVYKETLERQLKLQNAKYERKGADYSMAISPTLSSAASNQSRRINEVFEEKFELWKKEMKNTYRMALLYPTFFMIRRILYSLILVFMLNYDYFQIQLVIIKTALFGAYLGYYQVFQQRLMNRLEITNESLTMMCAYCIIPFTGFVSDAGTRYACGWPLIGLVFFLLILNLSILIIQGVKMIIRNSRLYMLKKRYQQAMAKRSETKLRRAKELARIDQDFKPEEKFCDLDGFASLASQMMEPYINHTLAGIDSQDMRLNSQQNIKSIKPSQSSFLRLDSHNNPNNDRIAGVINLAGSGSLQRINSIRSRGGNNALESISSEEVQVNLHPNIKLHLDQQTPQTQNSIYRNQFGGTKATKVMPVDEISDLDTKRSLLPMYCKSKEINYDIDDLDSSQKQVNDSLFRIQLRSGLFKHQSTFEPNTQNFPQFPISPYSKFNTAHKIKMQKTIDETRALNKIKSEHEIVKMIKNEYEQKFSNFLNTGPNKSSNKSGDQHVE